MRSSSASYGRRALRGLLSGASALVLALGLGAGASAAAEPGETTTIGEPGRLTLTVPKRVAAGETAVFDIAYTNTSGRFLERAEMELYVDRSVYGGAVDHAASTWADENGHTQSVEWDPPSWPDKLKITWTGLQPGDCERLLLSLPFRPTYQGNALLFTVGWIEYHQDGADQYQLGSVYVNEGAPATDLAVTMAVTPLGRPTARLTATVTVVNNGPTDAAPAYLYFRTSAAFRPLDMPGCVATGSGVNEVRCTLETLPVGGSATRQVDVRLKAKAELNGSEGVSANVHALPQEEVNDGDNVASVWCTRHKKRIRC
ncbi:hypothetical protein [Sphaerisporangium sp. TRM90804]|uniref:hypothetical protein n=1 Tax=Sphaerisporangium sp. TRM90804 TaxID=3031113 RepID=UPI002449DACE|nr:hypothetical protein [Sphaerisporangium sp. TRM90804]MDH2427973.1 hypothetical protein [Sphaerisporangium sp. TRM90804]